MYVKPDAEIDDRHSPLWIVSYTDLLSLLLTFFVMLVSFYRPHTGQLRKMAVSLEQTLAGDTSAKDSFEHSASEALKQAYLSGVQREAERSKRRSFRRESDIRTASGYRPFSHLTVHFNGSDTGLDVLRNRLLERVSVLFKATPYTIEIQSYTDGLYADDDTARRLAFNRSMAVARYLIDRGFSTERITLSAVKEPSPEYPPGSVEVMVVE